LTGEAETSCLDKLQTAGQKCAEEKQKLVAEVMKLEELVKDLQTEKQRVMDEQSSTKRRLHQLQQLQESQVNWRPDDLQTRALRQKLHRRVDQAGMIQDQISLPNDQTKEEFGPDQPSSVPSRKKKEDRIGFSQEATERKILKGASRQASRQTKKLWPWMHQYDRNRTWHRMEQNHVELARRVEDRQLNVGPDIQQKVAISGNATLWYNRRKSLHRKFSNSSDGGPSQQPESQRSSPNLGQRDGDGDVRVLRRGERSAVMKERWGDGVGTQEEAPDTAR